MLSAIGHLHGDAGLRQLLHESGVFAAGSVQQILYGRDFDRALYAMKLVDEALNARLLSTFQEWCGRSSRKIPGVIAELLQELENHLQTKNEEAISETIGKLNTAIDEHLQPLLDEFRAEGRDASPTFKFWNDFLEKVLRPLKIFISSARHGFWEEQQSAKAEFLPYQLCTIYASHVTYDETNPSRCVEAVSRWSFCCETIK